MAIQITGHFTAIGMRAKVEISDALVINTCSENDSTERGSFTHWSWSNPTNRAVRHYYQDVSAVSVEALWQGTKILKLDGRPNPAILEGDWRKGKAKRPIGAWRGEGIPLITNVGGARRATHFPAYARLVEHWMQDRVVQNWVQTARDHKGPVLLRDFDTGRGVDRNGPMSHAWLLSEYLNTGRWPGM